jgi:DNA-binding CsgD family transcriptional regulator
VNELNISDVESLLSAVAELNSSVDPDTLPGRMPSAVARVFDCEMVSFDDFSPGLKYIETRWHNNSDILTPPVMEAFSEVYNSQPEEHPLAYEILHKGNNVPLRMSDCVSNLNFENKAIFCEFFRRIGIRYQLGLAMPITSDLTVSCALNRASKDFTEKDKLLMGMLVPHLINSVRASLIVRQMRDRAVRLESLLELVSRGTVTLSTDGRILETTQTARTELVKYFPRWESDAKYLPQGLVDILTSNYPDDADGLRMPCKPLVIERRGSSLKITPIRNTDCGEVTLILEERGRLSTGSLASVGLTQRESEVLRLIEFGKSNDAIATLCGISKRTVQKHVENIFKKLNVETRTAAVRSVIEAI